MTINADKFRQALDLLKEALEDTMPPVEPVLNKSRLAKVTGLGTRTIAELMRSGAVPTYDQGKKAKASDIQKAMQDRPARQIGRAGLKVGLGKSYTWKVF